MLCSPQYKREFGMAMMAYVVTIFASTYYLKINPESPVAALVAILPVIPAIFAAVTILREFNRLDELQLRIQLNSLGISFLVTAIGTFSYGFLENIGYPHLPLIWILPFMVGLWGLATPFVARSYR
ncbi:hypothetical protein [Simiduia aestuariiviva]|uniref:Uncharacterized protein n=1 Tax=Simiduia aestuariiviva TaxID=1510459 RepID=A0A839UTE6_9GAMM|nr:hypothetical protein [Simiduia aestuariiviva]MBB3169236.1 hypothetical protein [Simiduia aestuariiviva]